MKTTSRNKHPGGRPIKFTKEMRTAVIDGLRKGLTRKAACKACGLSYSTLAAWLYKGKVSLKEGVDNECALLLNQVNQVTDSRWVERREQFFFNLKPRDYRTGWKNPMSVITKKKLRDVTKKTREKYLCEIKKWNCL